MNIAILTDSSYDGKLTDYKDLYMVPLLINTEDGQEFQDDENFDKDKFYELLETQVLKTAQTPPGIMLPMWDKLLEKYDQIICAFISKGLSGQFNTYRMISETESKYKGKVFVTDTNGVSIVQQHIVGDIAKWISQNKTGFEIIELVKQDSEDFKTFIIPKTLDTLKRGGRITPAAASLAKILKIVPVLSYDGTIDKAFTTRTFKKAIVESVKELKKSVKGLKKVDLTHSRAEEETIDLVKSIIEKEGLEIGLDAELTNVISAHTGPSTFAIVAWKE
ncbi:DegV family protein [Mesoplasma lactucae]|uniref:6-phosphogluconate dehydratase n=1 Tax=Mesoplasma lactucae ATCC 49193 TaxID=81460 RepID=A0A291IS96_9MOLU|nr:DegV family protein [Mesoplasma lactucae]ATG97567.1 6-phosphogluconate dehydratase [Mesoplasma lactucae ATCC 49193]ATZ19974.1 fatty acid-binding protein DegV [Mesoplasma lactucae ATCC 49193]MCL8217075.1 DegV domain-containing protein [Mesoplasma lactucae ATCC 49193]